MTPPKKQWADAPIPLILASKAIVDPEARLFSVGAQHMCHLHNCVFRGYNSIYQQAPYVPDQDKADFIGYCLTWFKFVKSHHDDEEENLFPQIEALLGLEGYWVDTLEEHKSFMGGLVEFEKYLTSLASPTEFSGTELLRIMDSFCEPFETHFRNEISRIGELAGHPKAPAPNTPKATEVSLALKTWGKNTVMKAGVLDVVPFFLLNLDRTADGGLWANWPPIPAPIKWGLVNLAGSWHGRWWKFASCDAAQQPQELYALQFSEEKP